MALVVLDPKIIGPYISQAWQRNLNTGEDPANGKWYTNGANNDNIGLYGGLSDSAATSLNLNKGAQQYLPQLAVCNSAITDNRNGLQPSATVTLSYTYSDATTYTQSTTASITAGVSATFSVTEGVPAVASSTQSFTFNLSFTYSFTSTTATSTTNATTFSQAVPVTVPEGKVYKTVLTATVQKLIIPYTAAVTVTGTTETWFEDRINGHYNWMVDAGTMFSWINSYGTAGTDSSKYGRNSAGQGTVTLSGTITAQATSNFTVQTYDITSSYNPPANAARMAQAKGVASSSARLLAVGASPVPEGKLIDTRSF